MKSSLLFCMLLSSSMLFSSEPAKPAAASDDSQSAVMLRLFEQMDKTQKRAKQALLEINNPNNTIKAFKSGMEGLFDVHTTFIQMESEALKLNPNPLVENLKQLIAKQKNESQRLMNEGLALFNSIILPKLQADTSKPTENK